ncbi:MAG TPA: hypothetical protein VJ579_00550 [Candidatus Paceibacterota bacterium]|nr:hypothetical protein [Candidatus Paceibacterota bacterium]
MPIQPELNEADPRSTLPMGGQEQRWISLFTQLLSNQGLGLDDPSISPLDLLIRCTDHFVFTLARYKRNYRDPKGEIVSHNQIFRVLITAYRDPVSRLSELCKKEHFFTNFHQSLIRSRYTLE